MSPEEEKNPNKSKQNIFSKCGKHSLWKEEVCFILRMENKNNSVQ